MEYTPDLLPESPAAVEPGLVTLNMVLPHSVDSKITTKDYGRFIISSLERGYGLTLGNALRRVLLSSLTGAAVTSIKVSGVNHEFSEIPHVREDMTQLILQIKQLRLQLHGVDKQILKLRHRGAEGTVTAADIAPSPEVQIENPGLYLFTVDDRNADIEMEFTVKSGRGFSPAEEREKTLIGELPVDAIFSPIKRVNFEVDRARRGQHTNYDALILDIWTDGTIRPDEALAKAAQILMHHLKVVAGVDEEWFQAIEMPQQYEEEPTFPKLYEKPIEELDLSVRVFNSLKRTGITSIGDVLDMLNRGSDAMLAIRNFGEKSLDELEQKLKEKNYWIVDKDKDKAE